MIVVMPNGNASQEAVLRVTRGMVPPTMQVTQDNGGSYEQAFPEIVSSSIKTTVR